MRQTLAAILLVTAVTSMCVASGVTIIISSPLFGSPKADGQQFDNAHASGALFAVGVSSLTICYGEAINGFQANF